MSDSKATEMVAMMVHGNGSNGPWQQQRQWVIATAMVMAMAAELELELADGNGKEDSHGKGNHEGRVASSCGGNVQRFWRGDTLPPHPWT
jgi:hypothetical protein